ncbi:MAG: DNA-binding protein [Methanosarcinales archaeon]|nr:DNA-binding protein [Methanosarcinales archaeon]
MNKINIVKQQSDFPLYTSNEGKVNDEVFQKNETIWLTQKAIGKRFEKSKPTINEHLSNIFNICEFDENSVVRNFRTVQTKGLHQIAAQNTLIPKYPTDKRRVAV